MKWRISAEGKEAARSEEGNRLDPAPPLFLEIPSVAGGRKKKKGIILLREGRTPKAEKRTLPRFWTAFLLSRRSS